MWNWQSQVFKSMDEVTFEHLHGAGLTGAAFSGAVQETTNIHNNGWSPNGWLRTLGGHSEYQFHGAVSVRVGLSQDSVLIREFLNTCNTGNTHLLNWNYQWCENRVWRENLEARIIWSGEYPKLTTIPVHCQKEQNSRQCQGYVWLDVRNFLSTEQDTRADDLQHVSTSPLGELNKLSGLQIVSNSDFPIVLSFWDVTMYIRPSLAEVRAIGRWQDESPVRRTTWGWTKPFWALSDQNSEEAKWTLIGRCFTGDINWCAPVVPSSVDENGETIPAAWFYRDITDENAANWESFALESRIVKKKMSDGVSQWSRSDYSIGAADLNVIFAGQKENKRFGCPRVGATCGPLRQNRLCNGLEGKTHCHVATGMCITYDSARELNLLDDGWGVKDITENCQSRLATATVEIVSNNVQWEHVFGNDPNFPKSINRPVRDGWCSVGDTWGGAGDNVGTMFPSHLAAKPEGWEEIHRFNDTGILGGDSQLFMGTPICPADFLSIGSPFANSVDELYNLDLSQYCCIPEELVHYIPFHRLRGHNLLAHLQSNRDKNGVCIITGSRWGRQTPILVDVGCDKNRLQSEGDQWFRVSNHVFTNL